MGEKKYDAGNPYGGWSSVPEEETTERVKCVESPKQGTKRKAQDLLDFDYDLVSKHRVISQKGEEDEVAIDDQYGFGESGYKEDGYSKAPTTKVPEPAPLSEAELKIKKENEIR